MQLYIISQRGGFTTVPMRFQGKPTPKTLAIKIPNIKNDEIGQLDKTPEEV